jgi:hypothetical protein
LVVVQVVEVITVVQTVVPEVVQAVGYQYHHIQ